ncbi:hypothetical protein TRVA0_035S00826 [Trichomonascus vanleenenianus]|uniref:complex I NDUFA5 subunit family protein n=1 Tax=Trichomonascus vanleenenianus TaxID=2268995 RepID=UPI003ECAAA14
MRFTRYLLNAAKSTNNRVLVRTGSGDPTGITGVFRHPNPQPALIALYEATLKEVSALPQTSIYRQSVENLTKARKEAVESSQTAEQVEQKIGAGLIEEILIQANEELSLIKQMAEAKPWEELIEAPEPGQWEYFEREH